MTTDNTMAQVIELETSLRGLSRELTTPNSGECLVCYALRMLEQFGCRGLTWATRFRDLQAPRATALTSRLAQLGAFCDCEILLNAYELDPSFFSYDQIADEYLPPDTRPSCRQVRRGSVQPCRIWHRPSWNSWW
jgi:hypothetical protein